MKLYLKFFSIHLKSQMQYKTSLLLTIFGQFLTSFTALLGMWFMFSRFQKVEGFTFQQVLLCSATMLMAFSIAECFARGVDQFPQMIGNGEFDRALVRPRSLVFQVLASKIDFTRLGRFIQAVILFGYAVPTSGVEWTPTRIATLVLMVLCGSVTFFCLFLLYAGISFFTLEGLEFMNIFTDGGREFGQYPFVIYGQDVLRVLTYVVPLALFQYYPFLYLLGRETHVLYMLMPLANLLFIVPTYAFWQFGLSRYKSTGS